MRWRISGGAPRVRFCAARRGEAATRPVPVVILALVLSTTLAGAVLVDPVDAQDDERGGTGVDYSERTLIVTAGAPGSLTLTTNPGRGGGGPTVRCAWFEIIVGGAPIISIVDAIDPTEGAYHLLDCWTTAPDDPLFGYPIVVPYPGPRSLPGPAISTGEAARYAIDRIDFEAPGVELSPPSPQIVGIPTWLAVTSRLAYDAVSAEAGPVWATVRPVFRDATWDLGNGRRVTCADDATTTWDPTGPPAQASACTHTYESASGEAPYGARVTISWTIHQLTDKSAGSWQVWGTVSITTAVDIEVHELQAAIG